MKFVNYSLILITLFLTGCGTREFRELGFEVNVEPINKPKQVWVAPIKLPEDMSWNYYSTQIRVNLAEELERKAKMTVSVADNPTIKDDYRMHLIFNKYKLWLDYQFKEGTYSCDYKATLTVEDNQQLQIFNQQNHQSRHYPAVYHSEQEYTNKADDVCFQARSQLVETLLSEFILSLEGR